MTATATDPGGLSAMQVFTVTVRLADREVRANADGRVDTLRLSSNRLTGEIPPELGDLSSLEYLSLSFNSLTGEISSELGSLSNLEGLYLHANSLAGEIPPDFLDLSSLLSFHWFDNHGLCAPNTIEFDEWLDGLMDWAGPRCD